MPPACRRLMLDLLTDLVARAPRRCAYADARHVTTDREHVLVRDGHAERVDGEAAGGIGVRVRAGGGWGFAATRDATLAGAERALARALAIAESQPAAPAGAPPPPPPGRRGLGGGQPNRPLRRAPHHQP